MGSKRTERASVKIMLVSTCHDFIWSSQAPTLRHTMSVAQVILAGQYRLAYR